MSTHNLQIAPSEEDSGQHRIGSVSRLAGVPVSTLRMWEGRHAAFAPGKTQGQHRLYGDEDVVRARLLRQLTESGHSISGIARLPAQQLQQLLHQSRAADARQQHEPRRLAVVVVGSALATRLTSARLQQRLGPQVLQVRRVFAGLEQAGAAATREEADLLLVRVNALRHEAVDSLRQLRERTGLRHAVVLYNFAADATVAALRDSGFMLRREPIEEQELASLLASFTWAEAPQGDLQQPAAAIPHRRFSDEDLVRVAAAPMRMLCECPRHIAEIIGQLASFEDYSARCLNDTQEDAEVHARLRSIAGSARAMFESALDMVMAAENGGLAQEQPHGLQPHA